MYDRGGETSLIVSIKLYSMLCSKNDVVIISGPAVDGSCMDWLVCLFVSVTDRPRTLSRRLGVQTFGTLHSRKLDQSSHPKAASFQGLYPKP